jgi:hypothetical protein
MLPQVSDVYLEAGFLYNSEDVMYLTDSCQLHFGRMDLTDIAGLTSNNRLILSKDNRTHTSLWSVQLFLENC